MNYSSKIIDGDYNYFVIIIIELSEVFDAISKYKSSKNVKFSMIDMQTSLNIIYVKIIVSSKTFIFNKTVFLYFYLKSLIIPFIFSLF